MGGEGPPRAAARRLGCGRRRRRRGAGRVRRALDHGARRKRRSAPRPRDAVGRAHPQSAVRLPVWRAAVHGRGPRRPPLDVLRVDRRSRAGGMGRCLRPGDDAWLSTTPSSSAAASTRSRAALGDDLAARGLEYLNTELPTATAFPDGSAAFLLRDAEGNAAELGPEWPGVLERFSPNADLAFGLLGAELWGASGLALAAKAYRRLGRRGLAAFMGELLQSSRDWLQQTFASERAHGVLAPWLLHTGRGPDAASSGFMTQVIAVAVQEGGMPIPRGGGAKLVDALVQLIRDHGGTCKSESDVERIVVRNGRAAGVRLSGGESIEAGRAVIANVTPTQLYERLLDGPAPEGARNFRYGRAEMQIHFALSEPAGWEGDERLNGTAIVHVTPGLDGVSRAVNEAERGLLPDEATIVVGQPLTLDPSRAPEGRAILWIQLQELPSRIKGDAAGEIDVGDGEWTDELREHYADRIQAR